MKNRNIVLLLGTLILALLIVWFLENPRGISIAGRDFGGSERGWLQDRTIDFLEDIQFKDFTKASTYHLAEAQKARDIPELIRRVFGIKHEILDILNYRVVEVDLDRGKARARVRVFVNYRVLGDKEIRENEQATRDVEMLFYWFRQGDGTWTMELESSLR